MYRPPPKLDNRSARAVYEEVCRRLEQTTSWSRPDAPAEALIHVFSKYAETIIDRLNRVPEKNLLAFLNLLGVSPVPASPATVPLTFVPVEGVSAVVRVPAQTQVASPPQGGDAEPVVFETQRPLELTSAKLRHVFLADPPNDQETDFHALADAVISDEAALFADGQRAPHTLFLAHRALFGLAQGARLRLSFDISAAPTAAETGPGVEWAIQAGDKCIALSPTVDTTNALSQSGEVVFDGVPSWPESTFQKRSNRWLTCRLLGSLPPDLANPWTVRRVEINTEVKLRSIPVDAVFSDVQTIDGSKDFLPFGARPAFGSTLYIASRAAFLHEGTRVMLNVKLTNPVNNSGPSPIPTVYADGHPRIWWEYWNGAQWERLAETDSTKSFRIDGVVGFSIPADAAPVMVNGIDNCWIRARLASGNYGEEERWEVLDPAAPAAGVRRHPATLSAPSIQSLTMDYERAIPPEAPELAIVQNGRVLDDVTQCARKRAPFEIFSFPDGLFSTLELGFEGPATSSFTDRSLSLYFSLSDAPDRPFSRSPLNDASSNVVWQCWTASGWMDLHPVDHTNGLSSSGVIAFIVPDNAAPRSGMTSEPACYWLRLVARVGASKLRSRLRGILRNTTIAIHALRLENEVVGSSNGVPLQSFFAARIPILKDVELQVRESELPSGIARLLSELSVDTVEIQNDRLGRPEAAWVRWSEVHDFLGSTAEDRHFTLDRETGELRFGDGRLGRIPPRGGNNIRLRRYSIGGGARGNQPPNKIVQVRSAIPYVQSVNNFVAASGGFEMEDGSVAAHRGAKVARHRHRAVTAEDYEDLAPFASPEIARAKCIPMRDLAADPDASRYYLGTISLIVVSNCGGKKPACSAPLLEQVVRYLDGRRDPSAELVVIGAEFVAVSAKVEFTPANLEEAGTVAAAIQNRLEAFLHPVSGGATYSGWHFGQLPKESELFGVCASVPGVNRIESLRIDTSEERAGTMRAGNFLIYSGGHEISTGTTAGRTRRPV